MSVSQMTFDRVWTSATDFPTYVAQEETVRADMQYLFDFIKNHFNNFVTNELLAENIPFSPTPGAIEAVDLQSAIEAVHQEVVDVTQDSVADGSITLAKLCQVSGSEAVDTDAIRDGAIISSKIADGTITAAKLASGAISGGSLAAGSVTGTQLANGAVSTDKLGANAVTRAKLGNEAVGSDQIAAAAVTTAKLGSKAVATGNIADGAVGTNQLANSAVTSAKLGAGSVITAKLSDGAVTNAKIQDGTISYAKTDGTTIQKKHAGPIAVTIAVADWNSSLQATKTVSGIKTDNSQFVTWTPADASYALCANNGVRSLITPPAANQVKFQCDTKPTGAITVYFTIFD